MATAIGIAALIFFTLFFLGMSRFEKDANPLWGWLEAIGGLAAIIWLILFSLKIHRRGNRPGFFPGVLVGLALAALPLGSCFIAVVGQG